MTTMRRAPLHRHGRFFCFLFLILCIPVIEKDDDLPKYEEKRIFFCKQSDFDGNSAPPFILESFIAKDSSSLVQPNKTLSKTLWALKVDREEWHGELINTSHGQSTSNTFVPREVGQRNLLENSLKPLQAFSNSAAERVNKNGKGILVMHCNPRNSNTDSTGHNHSIQGRVSQQQSSVNIIADEALLEKLQVLIRPTPNVYHTMAFHLHNQCSWPHEGYTRSAVFSFFQDNKAVQILELDFNSSLFPSLQYNTLRERVNRLLDERNTKCACNQGMSREFIVKNMRNLPLQVHSLLKKGGNSKRHGFKVEHFDDFYLGPWQTARLLVSYQPDFKAGIVDEELQFMTSAGMLSVTLKANVPKHIQSLCQNAALIARAKRIILQVCSLALFIVLLVFGRMLKQEGLIMSTDASQWSTVRNATKLPQRTPGRSTRYHDDKRSSIYVSIDIGCTHSESKQCGLSLTKALDVVHAAINCIVSLKLLSISHSSNPQQPEMNIAKESDLQTQHNDATTSLTSGMTGKRRASTHLRGFGKQSPTNLNGETLSLRSKACSTKKTVSQLDEARFLEKTEPESPSAAHSDKENERMKQRRKKKGAHPLAPGMETGSDSGSSSPLSMPSSPVVHDVLCRPVSPLSFGAHTSIHKCEAPVKMDAAMIISFVKDGHRASQKHCSTDSNFSIDDGCYLQKAKTNVGSKDSEANSLHVSHARNLLKNINQEGRSLEAKSVDKPSERNLVKVATVRSSSKGIAATRPRVAMLTASATFPAPGRRPLQESVSVVQEEGQNRSMVWSSSSSDLVSTSVIAPHARAPGSPLSPKSPSFSRNTLSSSLFTAPSSSRQCTQGNVMCNTRNSQRNEVKGKAQEIFYYNASGGSSPRQMHGPRYSQRRQDPQQGSDSVLLYDIWGDRFADLGRRWGPYWIGKDAPITTKPSSLPPLLQTPQFSVFSSNDPFSR
ncbi:hypothetical protein GOP47_0010943 [Adiantum capillus-veneris]|uniref:TMEM131L fifth Ig-like domain-containing protein n=1 Tax=Adiantum capillus-veneris TaxID=13818 RepID=A0A9D4UX31_ADICA|nr:hypothetical protein GOP47_0010943 [Adiantum capillus-veneris]